MKKIQVTSYKRSNLMVLWSYGLMVLRSYGLTVLFLACFFQLQAQESPQYLKVYIDGEVLFMSEINAKDLAYFSKTPKWVFNYRKGNDSPKQIPISAIDSIVFAKQKEETGVVINGVCWATRNVAMPGKFAAKPEDAGMLYQWDNKIGWSSADPLINSNNEDELDYYTTPDGISWQPKNDPCPIGWRVPTIEEMESLIASGSVWNDDFNGVKGRVFDNAHSKLFLQAAGYRENGGDGALFSVGSEGYYWSGTLQNTDFAQNLYFTEGYAIKDSYHCSLAFPLRCVKDANQEDVGVVINGVRWATRNLAAHGRFVAKPEDYGALFQWGRKGDGHEQRTSSEHYGTISAGFDDNGQIKDSEPAYGKFITTSSVPKDWRSPQIYTLWNRGSETSPIKTANDPCPAGWRLPTKTELADLITVDYEWKDDFNGAKGLFFGSETNGVFFPAAGFRGYEDGTVEKVDFNGCYWVSTVGDVEAYYLFFDGFIFEDLLNYRAFGLSVRCVAK